MNSLKVQLQNCYGIKKLKTEFKFDKSARTFSIYAPNGVMKTSFAKTFLDLSKGDGSTDLAFPDRETVREVTSDEIEIKPENILVIEPYNEGYESEKISTLLANKTLKEKYEKIHESITESESYLIKKLKEQSGIKKDDHLRNEIESVFGSSSFDLILKNEKNILETEDAPFAEIKYSIIFDDKVNNFLNTEDSKKSIKEYIEKYQELTDKSSYLKKEFNLYQAEVVEKSLNSTNFFKAGHSVNLFNGKTREEYFSESEFKALFEKEKKKVFEDEELKNKFNEFSKKLKNAELRKLRDYLTDNQGLLPKLSNIENFKKEVWVSFLVKHKNSLLDFNKKYADKQEELKKLVETSKNDKTSWDEVIKTFNLRFSHMPFSLDVDNREDVILKEDVPSVKFCFKDSGREKRCKDKTELLRILSAGEKKALYLLNIMFEVEIRKKGNGAIMLIIDDIATSFDYKNKYAIVEYLKYMSEEKNFFMIILTHNFDFYRTIQSRNIVSYDHSLIAIKNSKEIKLCKIKNLKNPFIKDWKKNLDDDKKLIASIPFLRNIIEYTNSEENEDYLLLTSILHYTSDNSDITLSKLECIFKKYISGVNFPKHGQTKKIIDLIYLTAEGCLKAEEGVNLENKIVLSIAIRLKAEAYMESKITDRKYLSDLKNSKNRFWKLLKKYEEEVKNEEKLDILNRVNLMTPENIHVNSFMYEPILDMGDEELRELYKSVKKIDDL